MTAYSREEHLAVLRLQISQGREYMKTPKAIATYANSPDLQTMKLRQIDVLKDLGVWLSKLPKGLWDDHSNDASEIHADRLEDRHLEDAPS